MTTADSITVTTKVAVDAAMAFKVFTDEIGDWWIRRPFRGAGTLRFESGPDGRLLELDRNGSREIGRVLVWEPGKRLVFEWRPQEFQPEQKTEVEVRFEPDGDGTRVTLEHRGWDAIPPGHPARFGWTGTAFTSLVGLWWADLLVTLKSRGGTQPLHDGICGSAGSARTV
jgi:uncharacterized protein YndB with AHSA1/START domain